MACVNDKLHFVKYLGLGLMISYGSLALAAPVQKIVYRTTKNTKAYQPIKGVEYLTIKVTPPARKGPKEVVFVEVYNYTRHDLSLVTFDLTLINHDGFDLETKVEGLRLAPNASGVSKIPTPGQGAFPMVRELRIENLRIVDSDAKQWGLEVLVDLIRPDRQKK